MTFRITEVSPKTASEEDAVMREILSSLDKASVFSNLSGNSGGRST
ncbi:MAG: hypothetical protein WCG55_04725 [bacterium]